MNCGDCKRKTCEGCKSETALDPLDELIGRASPDEVWEMRRSVIEIAELEHRDTEAEMARATELRMQAIAHHAVGEVDVKTLAETDVELQAALAKARARAGERRKPRPEEVERVSQSAIAHHALQRIIGCPVTTEFAQDGDVVAVSLGDKRFVPEDTVRVVEAPISGWSLAFQLFMYFFAVVGFTMAVPVAWQWATDFYIARCVR